MQRIALFAGTFDPYTIGHHHLVERALPLFDQIVIAIGCNSNKKPLFTIEQRIEQIEKLYLGNNKIVVKTYTTLTTDFAQSIGATFLLRGVRSTIDFEYEKAIAEANRKLTGIETILMISDSNLSFISSSLIRELASFGKDITDYLP